VKPRCATCLAPLDACFCAAIPHVPSRTRVVVVRHVAERRKVSNTGGLASRVIGGRLVDHGGPGGPTDVGDLGDAPALLFTGGRTADWTPPSALIVLDGTWGQVRAMRRRIPRLESLPVLSLPGVGTRRRMRRQHLPEGLSTLEAIAAALDELGEPEPAAALRSAFERATATWLALRSR
jgi:DTW domain-containing protein YfiP